jgi:hypothetical protein
LKEDEFIMTREESTIVRVEGNDPCHGAEFGCIYFPTTKGGSAQTIKRRGKIIETMSGYGFLFLWDGDLGEGPKIPNGPALIRFNGYLELNEDMNDVVKFSGTATNLCDELDF